MTRSKIFIIAIILCLSRPLLAIAGDRDDGSPDSKSSGPIAENDRNKLIEFIAGTVQTPDGKPAAGAHVVIIGTQWRGDHVTSTAYPIELIALETCDQNGSFRMDHLKPSHGRWQLAQLIVVAKGYGLVWRRIDLYEAVRNPIRITLPIAHTMRGRLNTADGHPAAGVAVEVMSIGQTRDTDKLLLYQSDLPGEIYPIRVVTDVNGEFHIDKLPRDTGVLCYVDQATFAPTRWFWTFDDSTPHSITLAMGRVVSGTVVASDTGEPLPAARIVAPYAIISDAQGQFKFNHPSAEHFDIEVYPPSNTPYLGKRFGVNRPEPGAIAKLRLELPRGTLVRGQVVEQTSGRPIPHAGIEYIPQDDNIAAQGNPFRGGNFPATIADDQGSFVMGVPTGPGTLVVTSASVDDVHHPVSRVLLTTGKPGDELNRSGTIDVFAQMPIEVPEGVVEFPVQLPVERGTMVKVSIVGVDGQVPDQVKMIVRDYHPLYSDALFRMGRPVFDGRLEIRGLASDEDRLVWLVDPLAKQGKLLHVKSTDANASRKVALEPCGSITMRFVDGENRPVAGFAPELCPIQLEFLPEEMVQGNVSNNIIVNADGLMLDLFDFRNAHEFTTGADGRMTFSALIPGAIYQVMVGGIPRLIKVGPGEHIELPVITITDAKLIEKAAANWKAKQTATAAESK
jgi:hypothetical protein